MALLSANPHGEIRMDTLEITNHLEKTDLKKLCSRLICQKLIIYNPFKLQDFYDTLEILKNLKVEAIYLTLESYESNEEILAHLQATLL